MTLPAARPLIEGSAFAGGRSADACGADHKIATLALGPGLTVYAIGMIGALKATSNRNSSN